MTSAAQQRLELRSALEFLQAVRQDPSLLQYFDETILSLQDLRIWAESLGYTLSDASLIQALETQLNFRWATARHRVPQPN